MSYQYYIELLADPTLEVHSKGRKEKHTPMWMEKLDWERKFREEIGEEKYQQLLKDEEERKTRRLYER